MILNTVDTEKYEFEIKRHAFIRAMQRNVSPDMIEATLKGGKIEKFGKNNIRFMKKYKRFDVICVGEINNMKVKIFTVEIKEK